MINESSIIEQFRAAMAAQGIATSDHLEGDGKIHRIHVDGDRKGSKNGWYCLHIDDKPAGNFGCAKRHGVDQKFSWAAKRDTKPLSAEERKVWREKMDRQRAEKAAAEAARHSAAAIRAKAIWDEAAPATVHPYLTRKGVKAHGLRIGKWEVVNPETGEIRQVSNHALLVPITDRTRQLRNLQAIFPSKIMGGGTRDKDYLKDGAKLGFFHVIGKPQEVDGKKVFIIAEGYATGASVHECTGHAVLVTFDTSNLLPVAKQLRERLPESLIIFAADNDQFTHQPVANPGVTYAKVAAQEVGGLVAVPQFASLDGEPTDFNDLHLREGEDAVSGQILAVLNLETAIEHHVEPESDVTPPWDDIPAEAYAEEQAPAPAAPKASAPVPVQAEAALDESDHLLNNGFFTILGYDEGDYYFFLHEKRQIMRRTKSDFTDTGLIEMAPCNWWEESFPGAQGGIDKKAACNWIFRTANGRGIYDPTRVRGRGAWLDDGRMVFHHGRHLSVDGQHVKIEHMQSIYVYPMGRQMPTPAAEQLTDDEGEWLISVAQMARWSMPGSAALLSGFALLAPICGALGWRPHIWLTGGPGSGKSTLQNKFLASLMAGLCVYAQGNSTEPGIRQELKADAIPVLIDEAESNNEGDKKRIENIIALIRQASSSSQAKTLKGTATGDGQSYHIQSMFCLASINVNLPGKADIDRLTKLVLRAPVPGGRDQWEKLEGELNRIEQDRTISSRLLARALNMMPIIFDAIRVFRAAAADHFGTQRQGDQFGTLLAGCWCLQKNYAPSKADAMVLIKGYDWKEHLEDHDEDDAQRALTALLDSKLRVGTQGEYSVFELVRESSTLHRHGVVDMQLADDTLRRHGIRAEHAAGQLWFGTSVSTLVTLVKGMSFVTDLRGQLLRVKGAQRIEGTKKFNGSNSKVVAVPLDCILSDDADEPPI